MKPKFSVKIAALFSFLIFLILSITTAFMGGLAILLFKLGVMDEKNWVFPVIFLGVVSVAVGTVLSWVFGKRPIRTIIEISEATKEVAKGNFEIALNEDTGASELRAMAHNFNGMIRELASTELLRSDFIENVSHEFKTPLSAIEGYVTLLQKKGLPAEKLEEYTGRILVNTKRLSALTGNILLLSRLENQEIEIKKERYSLDEQLRETVLLFEPQWTLKKLEFDIDLDAADYRGNKELLAQVWQNLLGNAIKFVADNGRIRVLLRHRETCVDISIVDNGPGMSRAVVERVYEKFYQADASRSSSGNGLGLALAKRIVDLHGGSITVSSKEGRGTAFTVSLPV